MDTPLQNGALPPGERRNASHWLPFFVVMVVAQVSVAVPEGPKLLGFYIASSVVLVATLALGAAPWQRLPRPFALVPMVGYLTSVGFLLVSGGIDPKIPSTAAGLSPLVLLPVIWAALFLPRLYTAVSLVGTVTTVMVVGIVSDNSAPTLFRKTLLWTTIGLMLLLSVHGLRDTLGRKIAEHADLLRRSRLMNEATRRLTALHNPDDVIREGVRIAAELASPSGSEWRRAAYLRVIGGLVVQQDMYDEAGFSPMSCLLTDHPYVRRVLQTGQPEVDTIDLEAIGPSMHEMVETTGMTDAAWIPIAPRGELHGILAVGSRGIPFSDDAFERCLALGDVVELALGNALNQESLQREATTDPLTGMANRRGLALAVKDRRGRRPYAFIVMDLDGLKRINDRHGHDAGDELLKAVATSAASALRSGDVLARLGGDEFAAFLVDAGTKDAAVVADRITDAISAVRVRGLDSSLSLGIACGGEHDDPIDVLQKADMAMYGAKYRGESHPVDENRVEKLMAQFAADAC